MLVTSCPCWSAAAHAGRQLPIQTDASAPLHVGGGSVELLPLQVVGPPSRLSIHERICLTKAPKAIREKEHLIYTRTRLYRSPVETC